MQPKQTLAKVIERKLLTEDIIKIILKPNNYISYYAGQYLQIMPEFLPDNNGPLFYSIANAQTNNQKYELHLRLNNITKNIKLGDEFLIRLPLGHCDWRRLDSKKNIIFIAQGTGFAPIKAIIEKLLLEKTTLHMELYWNARSVQNIYLDDLAKYWEQTVANFHYFSYPDHRDQERLLADMINNHKDNLLNFQIVLSGPFDRVHKARDKLLMYGAKAENLYSDAF